MCISSLEGERGYHNHDGDNGGGNGGGNGEINTNQSNLVKLCQ